MIGRVILRKKLENAAVIPELWRSYASLGNVDARRAFLRTLGAVIDPRGQSVSAADKLYLSAGIPTLIIWGAEDRVILVEHAHAAHAAIPGSWLEIIEGGGTLRPLRGSRSFRRGAHGVHRIHQACSDQGVTETNPSASVAL